MGSIRETKATTQDLADALQRAAQLKKTQAELMKALFNRRGLERLRDISDTDWAAAEARDNETN